VNTSRIRAALIIAAIAIGCLLAGAGIDRWAMRNARRGRGGPLGSATPEETSRRRAESLDRMTKDLDLTPTQRAGIDSVMQRTDSALHAVRSEIQPRLRQIFEASRAEIAARLDSTQRVKLARRDPAKRHRAR
jgi:Spy/CpxP family protein refolding chaperone